LFISIAFNLDGSLKFTGFAVPTQDLNLKCDTAGLQEQRYKWRCKSASKVKFYQYVQEETPVIGITRVELETLILGNLNAESFRRGD